MLGKATCLPQTRQLVKLRTCYQLVNCEGTVLKTQDLRKASEPTWIKLRTWDTLLLPARRRGHVFRWRWRRQRQRHWQRRQRRWRQQQRRFQPYKKIGTKRSWGFGVESQEAVSLRWQNWLLRDTFPNSGFPKQIRCHVLQQSRTVVMAQAVQGLIFFSTC